MAGALPLTAIASEKPTTAVSLECGFVRILQRLRRARVQHERVRVGGVVRAVHGRCYMVMVVPVGTLAGIMIVDGMSTDVTALVNVVSKPPAMPAALTRV